MTLMSEASKTQRKGADAFEHDARGRERRRGLRIRQNRPVKVFEPSAARYFGGQTQDISTTGLRVDLPISMAIRPGKILSIHVGLSIAGEPLANRRQMIHARVVWVNRNPEPRS